MSERFWLLRVCSGRKECSGEISLCPARSAWPLSEVVSIFRFRLVRFACSFGLDCGRVCAPRWHHLRRLTRRVFLARTTTTDARSRRSLAARYLLSGEERLDLAEERELLSDRVAAVLRYVDEKEHAARQVRERRDGLHLDRVPLVELVVEDPRRVDHLGFGVAAEREDVCGRVCTPPRHAARRADQTTSRRRRRDRAGGERWTCREDGAVVVRMSRSPARRTAHVAMRRVATLKKWMALFG